MRSARTRRFRSVWALVGVLVAWAVLVPVVRPVGPTPARVVWAAGSEEPRSYFRYLSFPRHAEVPVWDAPESSGPPTATLRRAIFVSQKELALAYHPIGHTHGKGFIRFADLTFEVPDNPDPLIRELERDFASRGRPRTCTLELRDNLHILKIHYINEGTFDEFRYVVADGAVSPREHRSRTRRDDATHELEQLQWQLLLWFAVAVPLSVAWGVLRFCTRPRSAASHLTTPSRRRPPFPHSLPPPP